MSVIVFRDMLYGEVHVPDWLRPFLRIPEFARLRGVGLSNIDSYQFKDFAGPSRWEHGIAVAALARRCAEQRNLGEKELIHLVLAALLHDVATPPFAHTGEYVLDNFDHELETFRVLASCSDEDFRPELPVFGSELPQFRHACRRVGREMGIAIDPVVVAELVVGEGELGFLLNGTIDLDNIDNVTRACLFLGVPVDRTVPLQLTDWLAVQTRMPTNLEDCSHAAVRAWLSYRHEVYSAFYSSGPSEQGREAFLQHLFRRALGAGVPRRALIWNTDEGLLNDLAMFRESPNDRPSLSELVNRYRLLEEPTHVAEVPVATAEQLRILSAPPFASWLEDQLAAPGFEAAVTVARRRFGSSGREPDLFPPPAGAVHVFKFGQGLKVQQLPTWLANRLPSHRTGLHLIGALQNVLQQEVSKWLFTKPWLQTNPARVEGVVTRLKAVGDWSFRLSRNESLHPYPGTFVHAIPAALLHALGVRGGVIMDPFAGTGQTGSEAVKYGARAVLGDSNTIACLTMRARLSFLSPRQREVLRAFSANDLFSYRPADPPPAEEVLNWFHGDTLAELCRIWAFVCSQKDRQVREFLIVCFSAILPACTGRRGEQHGYFADNSPLSKGQKVPTKQHAVREFVARVDRSLSVLERFYAHLERDGYDPAVELRRISITQCDATRATIGDYGLSNHSVDAIITSPPYLCMADYALGLRLSYLWVKPDALDQDFRSEMGARRQRINANLALTDYFDALKRFAQLGRQALRPGGLLGTVLGAPLAKAFLEANIFAKFDGILHNEGFKSVWSKERSISWHRNHGYARLKTERVSVHVVR